MADPTQVSTFVNTYSPFATQAGAGLGVSPSTILAQWALESGYGTSNLAVGQGNLAGLTTPGSNGSSFQSFASPAAFETAYVNTIAGGFPAAENTGADLTGFVGGLASGNSGSYFGTQTSTSYLSSLSGALTTLEADAGVTPQSVPAATLASPVASGAAVAGAVSTAGTAASASGCAGGVTGLSGLFAWACWQNIITDLAFVAIGVLIFIVAVASGLFGGSSPIAKNVRRIV